jgi:hypothetical protein
MIAFPALAALIAFICAAFVGRDTWRRPRPAQAIWTAAFLVFGVAALAEVIGDAAGWNATLARLYYLTGAVLVVGILALGELYLLFPHRMPAVTPGLTLLVIAVAASVVWSAPIAAGRLQTDGWAAIERGPGLIALAAAINAGGTLVLAGGALYSAWRLRSAAGSGARALGCLLIAAGTIVVALGGTLTRFGHREYLYLAMAAGVAVIFAGVLLTRRPAAAQQERQVSAEVGPPAARPARLISLPARRAAEPGAATMDEGVRFIVDTLLPLDDEVVAEACRRWSAAPSNGDELTREQALSVWRLRLLLPSAARDRCDRLPLVTQAQLAELYGAVWSATATPARREQRA